MAEKNIKFSADYERGKDKRYPEVVETSAFYA
jgi:hypothetical protein